MNGRATLLFPPRQRVGHKLVNLHLRTVSVKTGKMWQCFGAIVNGLAGPDSLAPGRLRRD